MVGWGKRAVVMLLLGLLWALVGCVMTGGGQVGATVALGQEDASRPAFRVPTEPAENRRALEFFEDQ